MGAFDTYAATARCPACQQRWWFDGQTKFFDPDFGGLFHRHFTPGEPQPIDFPPAKLERADVWDDEWFRVREPGDDGSRFTLLLDFDELHACTCGVPLAIVLHFRLDPGTGDRAVHGRATLERVTVHDRRQGLYDLIDFAPAEFTVRGGDGIQAYFKAVRTLASRSAPERLEALERALDRFFAPPEEPAPSVWSEVAGPAQCEHCGATDERVLWAHLTHPSFDESLIGPRWTGGRLDVGAVVPGPHAWIDEDQDRGFFLRVRAPTGTDRVRVLGSRERWGCRCDAGKACVLMEFVRVDGGLRLDALRLRVVTTRADLDDIDFVFSPHCSRAPREDAFPRWVPGSREEALEALYARWQLTQ